MIRCGWLQDDHGYVGGAELTASEQRAAAPEDVEIVDCPAGAVVAGCDAYVVHNCVTYTTADLEPLMGAERVVRYVNDLWPWGDEEVRSWLLANACCLFTSPLHLHRFRWPVEKARVVPPAVELDVFRPSRQVARHPEKRKGAVAVGSWQNTGKGQQLLREWSDREQPVDVFGDGPFVPHGPNLLPRGVVSRDELPQLLWGYETFVHLPTEPEPFGRAVVEAWAAGLKLVVNNLVGARYFIEEAPEQLQDAGERFWAEVGAEVVVA